MMVNIAIIIIYYHILRCHIHLVHPNLSIMTTMTTLTVGLTVIKDNRLNRMCSIKWVKLVHWFMKVWTK